MPTLQKNDDDQSKIESIEHLMSTCSALDDIRSNIVNSMQKLCQESGIKIEIRKMSNKDLTQFLLDPSSLNLKKRVNINHPVLPSLFQLSRDFCYKIDRCRQNKVN